MHTTDRDTQVKTYTYKAKDEKQACAPALFIPLVITHGVYVSVGHPCPRLTEDIVHRCTLNGFIWAQCFSSFLISSWLTANAQRICSAFLPPLARNRWAWKKSHNSLIPHRFLSLSPSSFPFLLFIIISPSQTENRPSFACLLVAQHMTRRFNGIRLLEGAVLGNMTWSHLQCLRSS